MPPPYAIRMKMVAKPILFACLAAISLASGGGVHARDRQDGGQEAASQRRQQGGLLPIRAIEARVKPTMPGAQYLGFDFDPTTNIYTLKFLRNGSVIWVDVDGRTGRILRRTGN